jgi:hypothetical protein
VIVNDRGELVQKSDPVYLEPQRSGLFAAHFYAPAKRLAGGRLPTLWANILVIWAMSVLFMASLYTEAFPRLGRRLAVLLARQAA